MLAYPALMKVPEAAVDKDDFAPAGKDKVRPPGQLSAGRHPVKAVAVPLGVQKTAHQHLWFGVFASDPGHIPATTLRCQPICHGSSLSFRVPPRVPRPLMQWGRRVLGNAICWLALDKRSLSLRILRDGRFIALSSLHMTFYLGAVVVESYFRCLWITLT